LTPIHETKIAAIVKKNRGGFDSTDHFEVTKNIVWKTDKKYSNYDLLFENANVFKKK